MINNFLGDKKSNFEPVDFILQQIIQKVNVDDCGFTATSLEEGKKKIKGKR